MKLKELTTAGLIAAVYVVFAYFLAPISFGVYQVRVSEALTVLPFVTRAAIPGLFLGCLLANVIGSMGWMDIVFGSLLTLASAILTRAIYHLSKKKSSNAMAVFAVAMLWAGALYTLMGEMYSITVIALIAASILTLIASVRARVTGSASRNFAISIQVVSAVMLLLALSMLRQQSDWKLFVIGGIATIGAWAITWVLTYIWTKGQNPNTVLAPLPPVVLNAFGVSAYLAPIMGVNFWFAVQMIGVGQLVACYLLGLPLLLILEKRKYVFF